MSKLYSVYDSVSKEFASPIALKNDDVAKRWFRQQMAQVAPEVASDMSIYCIGDFNPDTGYISVCSPTDITELEDSVESTEALIHGTN